MDQKLSGKRFVAANDDELGQKALRILSERGFRIFTFVKGQACAPASSDVVLFSGYTGRFCSHHLRENVPTSEAPAWTQGAGQIVAVRENFVKDSFGLGGLTEALVQMAYKSLGIKPPRSLINNHSRHRQRWEAFKRQLSGPYYS
ncbi:MAG: hypothetical protein NT141_00130 [candidate division WWE3 bacterium]|nr:hypothetical protein [candidate division WWE3 bacterium]